MNGVMPGPLWLAIASATNSTSVENRNLTDPSKNATVTGKTAGSKKDVSDSVGKGIGDGEDELVPAIRRRRKGG